MWIINFCLNILCRSIVLILWLPRLFLEKYWKILVICFKLIGKAAQVMGNCFGKCCNTSGSGSRRRFTRSPPPRPISDQPSYQQDISRDYSSQRSNSNRTRKETFHSSKRQQVDAKQRIQDCSNSSTASSKALAVGVVKPTAKNSRTHRNVPKDNTQQANPLKITESNQSERQQVNKPQRDQSCSNSSKTTRLSSGLAVTIKSPKNDNFSGYTPFQQKTFPPKSPTENDVLPKAKSLKVVTQSVHSDVTHDLVDKRYNSTTMPELHAKEFTVVNIDEQPSIRKSISDQRREFMNDEMLQPPIKQSLLPEQSYVIKKLNNDNSQRTPMKANIGQTSEHDNGILEKILVDNYEKSEDHSPLLKFLVDYKNMPSETSLSEVDEGNDTNYAHNNSYSSVIYESHTASKSTMQSHQDFASFHSHSYLSLEPPEKPKRSSTKIDDLSSSQLDNATSPSSRGKGPLQTKIDNVIIKMGESKQFDSEKQHPTSPPSFQGFPGHSYQITEEENSVDDGGYQASNDASLSQLDNATMPSSRKKSPFHTNIDNVIIKMEESKQFDSEKQHPSSPPSFQRFSGHSHQITEEENSVDDGGYRASNDASLGTWRQLNEGSSTQLSGCFTGKSFDTTEEANKLDETGYQEPNELDVAFMEDEINDFDRVEEATEAIEPQKPTSIPDNRDYVPVFRDFKEIDENDLIDDLSESKITPETYNAMIKTLKKVYEQAKPFHEKIDQFTELENSNTHYYIEESLRRCIDKLDDMYDDIGDIKALRDERKKVYRFVFPMFERLDAKVQENKSRINVQEE